MGTIISHIVNWLAAGEEEKRLKGTYNQRRRPVRRVEEKKMKPCIKKND
jgi:hypothetical protein